MPALSLRTVLSFIGPFTLALGAVACGGDSETTSTSTSSSTGGSGGSGGMGTGGSGGTSTGGSGGMGTGGMAPAVEYDALVLGTLALANDLAAAKTAHDAVAGGGEAQVKALGDIGHAALLGTSLLGTQENQFLGFDRWITGNMDMVYNDPQFQAAFGSLFSAPPTLEKFQRQPTWLGWGDLDSGKAFPTYYYAVIRGTLKDTKTAQATHDMVAGAGKTTVEAAGDVAHVAFTGRDDQTKALFIDVWKDSAAITAVYENPQFQQGFAALFEGAPTIGIYKSTDWHQW